jgi:ribosomal protein S21
MKVVVRNNNIKRALSIFKRKHNDKMLDVRTRQYYTKPTERRNNAKRLAVIRERKRQANDKHPA